MPGKQIKDLCPSCGSNEGAHHDWFPELGSWDEWPCGSRRGIDRHTDQRITYASKTCQTIRDLKAKVAELEAKLAKGE